MKKFFHFLSKNKIHLLYIYPFFYLFAGIYFRLLLGGTSLRSVDPDYVYFINGLDISQGYFKVAHIDHPGTPLQYLAALVFRITYLFRADASTGYVQDVLSHSDFYLSILNLCITALLTVSIYVAGKYVYRKTGSVLYAMLVQTIPFISVILYEIIGRIIPELLIPLPLLALTAFFIGKTHEQNNEYTKKDLAVLSLIIAFGLSIKLTLILLWVIPLLVVKKWKTKMQAFGLSVVFFFIIAFPVALQAERFWRWTKALFIHSGQYGGGEKNIVDIARFTENLASMATLQTHFSYLVVIALIVAVVSFFRFWKKQNIQVRKKQIVLLAVLLAILVQIVVSGKHYAPRYFMPALMFVPLLVYLIFEITKELYSIKLIHSGLMILLSLFLLWHFRQQIIVINYTSPEVENHTSGRKKTQNIAETFEQGSIKIIVSQDYGCPFPEYALLFSTAWTKNKRKPFYAEELGKIYPTTYQYTTWDDKFRYWGDDFQPEKIIENNTPVYLYLEKNSEDLYAKTLKKLDPRNQFNINRNEIHLNPRNNEVLYQLYFRK